MWLAQLLTRAAACRRISTTASCKISTTKRGGAARVSSGTMCLKLGKPATRRGTTVNRQGRLATPAPAPAYCTDPPRREYRGWTGAHPYPTPPNPTPTLSCPALLYQRRCLGRYKLSNDGWVDGDGTVGSAAGLGTHANHARGCMAGRAGFSSLLCFVHPVG